MESDFGNYLSWYNIVVMVNFDDLTITHTHTHTLMHMLNSQLANRAPVIIYNWYFIQWYMQIAEVIGYSHEYLWA